MRIPITIYPARLNRENFDRLVERYSDDADRVNLWSDLLTAYDLFQSSHRLPEITFLPDGRHTLK